MMTFKRKLEFEVIFLIIIAVVVGIFLAVYRNNYKPQFKVTPNPVSMQVAKKVIAPKITVSSQISPDGTKKVIMRETENQDGAKNYDFSVLDIESASELPISTQVVSSGDMRIPFNTWSPDDRYFFIDQYAGSDKSVFVYKTDGAEFAPGAIFLDATDSFKKANTGNIFDEATGWASDTLIIVDTVKQDNSKGPSYWFEVPSKAIIQLSTEF
jgi:hypothetical protein